MSAPSISDSSSFSFFARLRGKAATAAAPSAREELPSGRTGRTSRWRRTAGRPADRDGLLTARVYSDIYSDIYSDLTDELPDEDLLESIDDCIDLYRMGSKPRCEEAEYLQALREARYRIERGY